MKPSEGAPSRGSSPSAEPSGADVLPGTRYRILGKIADGGMGDVFEGEHVGLKKRVVIKLLRGHYEGRVDILDRMRVEAQALALLNHPNIVQVSDFGETADGRTFLVMERLYGRTLREELKERGHLPALEAIAVTQQVLAGLSAAHGAGIIHRDIKLDNIFVCDPPSDARAGQRAVKLLDFGVVKLLSDGASLGAGRGPSQGRAPAPLAFPTATGYAVGTPHFFSPEQARGALVDARSDVYAAGLVLYALVAGRGPFDHINAIENILFAHAETAPEPPSSFAKVPVPPELERAILKALAKRPDDRFPSAAAFSDALSIVAARSGASAGAEAPGGAPPNRRWASTEPLAPPNLAGTIPLPRQPSAPADAHLRAPPAQAAPLLGKATERLPTTAELVSAPHPREPPSASNDARAAGSTGARAPLDPEDLSLKTTVPFRANARPARRASRAAASSPATAPVAAPTRAASPAAPSPLAAPTTDVPPTDSSEDERATMAKARLVFILAAAVSALVVGAVTAALLLYEAG